MGIGIQKRRPHLSPTFFFSSSFHIVLSFLLSAFKPYLLLSPLGQKECSDCFGLDEKDLQATILVGEKNNEGAISISIQMGFFFGILSRILHIRYIPNHLGATVQKQIYNIYIPVKRKQWTCQRVGTVFNNKTKWFLVDKPDPAMKWLSL